MTTLYELTTLTGKTVTINPAWIVTIKDHPHGCAVVLAHGGETVNVPMSAANLRRTLGC